MKRTMLLLGATTAMACRGDSALEPLAALPHSTAVASCGPADGPATYIYLAATPLELPQPIAPYLQVFVPRWFSASTSPEVFTIGDHVNENAAAWINSSGVEQRQAVSGEVGITSLRDNRLAGFVDLVFSNGLRLRGSFNAMWHEMPTRFCG